MAQKSKKKAHIEPDAIDSDKFDKLVDALLQVPPDHIKKPKPKKKKRKKKNISGGK